MENSKISWQLLAQYISNEASEKEREEVEAWIKTKKENAQLIDTLREKISLLDKEYPYPIDTDVEWKQMKLKLQKVMEVSHRRSPALIKWGVSIAASIALLVVAYSTIMNNYFNPKEYYALDTTKEITLADGSIITLNKNSTLSLFKDFGGETREVALSGEAFFDVKRDEQRPFIIQTGNSTTRVLGTSFNINAYQADHVSVTVLSGKVSFSSSNDEVILEKDDVAFYNKNENNIVKTENSDFNFLTWKTGVIRFENTSLQEVVQFLSAHYNIDILLESKEIQKCRITAVFDNYTLEEVLSALEHILSIQYTKHGNQIKVSGQECFIKN